MSDELRGAIELLRVDARNLLKSRNRYDWESAKAIRIVCDAAARARQAAESPAPDDDLVCCARCNEMKECLLIETGFAGEHEPLCAACISEERSVAKVEADELLEEIVKDVFSEAQANCNCETCLALDRIAEKIRARKGTFSLRASGAEGAHKLTRQECWEAVSRACDRADRVPFVRWDEVADRLNALLAAAPTLSEAGAKEGEHG